MGYYDAFGEYRDEEFVPTEPVVAEDNVDTGSGEYDDLIDYDFLDETFDEIDRNYKRQEELDYAEELKKKELYRKAPLKYDSNGELINDTNTIIRAKELGNTVSAAADWLLEASENLYDAGQGEWLNNAQFTANVQGKEVDMRNKDIVGARETSLEELKNQFWNAEENPNADKGIYALRKKVGTDENGEPVGVVSALDIFKIIGQSLEAEEEIAISGLNEDTVIYYNRIKEKLCQVIDKFRETLNITNIRAHVKEKKSVYSLNLIMNTSEGNVVLSRESGDLKQVIDWISSDLERILSKKKEMREEKYRGR